MSFDDTKDAIKDAFFFNQPKIAEENFNRIESRIEGAKKELLEALEQPNILFWHHHINSALEKLDFGD